MTTNDVTTRPPAPAHDKSIASGKLRDAINQAMGSVFFGPLLRSMRESSLKSEFGHGGRGEEVFAAQLDQILVERAGMATNFELSNVLYERFAPAAGIGPEEHES